MIGWRLSGPFGTFIDDRTRIGRFLEEP